MKPSIRPSMPAPTPTKAPVETTEPQPPAKIERELFKTWTLGGGNRGNYWQRPLRNGEKAKGYPAQERIIVSAFTSSSASYERIYLEAGHVFALTLGLAASFDHDGTSDPVK